MKRNKGITLIALVITIIVLLILAGVAIAMLSGENGILKKSAEAKTKTDEAQTNESENLKGLEYIIKKNTGERCWQYKKDSKGRNTIITDGTVELQIGTYVNYDPTKDENENEIEKTITSNAGSPTDKGEYKASEKVLQEGNGASDQTFSNKATTNGWRVLGVDEKTGELLIISASSIKTVDDENFELRGIAGYTYGESELNKVCGAFGYGKMATGARSVNVDDINKITGYNPNNVGVYDPEQKGKGTKYGSGDNDEYGNKVTYSWTTTTNVLSCKVGDNGTVQDSSEISKYADYGFNWYDISNKTWKSSMQNTEKPIQITTLTSTGYSYYADSLTATAGEGEGMSSTSKEYDTLFKDKYWLASEFVYATSYGYGIFGIHAVNDSRVVALSNRSLYYTSGRVNTTTQNEILYNRENRLNGIRPVVSLKPDIELKETAENSGIYDIQ